MSVLGQEITVLGAGISGLAVARALAMQGASVTVLEQAAAIGEVGAGIQISPNGMAVMDGLGVSDAIGAVGVRGIATDLRDHLGRFVAKVDLQKYAARHPYMYLHRADLIAVLAEGAREVGVDIRLGQAVDNVMTGPLGSTVTLADGTTSEHRILIGADGIKSHVRSAICADVPAEFTGHVAWRAVVPAPISENIATIYMGPRRHVVTYPLRGGTLMNLVMIEETDTWTDEGWSTVGDPDVLRDAFRDFDGVSDLLQQVEQVHKWGLFRHRVPDTWHRDGAVLMGDAAHPTLPFMAQGANLALEDAWVLARSLATADRPSDGMALYQSLRRDRVKRVLETAETNARLFHIENPMRRAVTHLGMRAAMVAFPARVAGRFDWIYRYDATDVI